MSGWVGGWVGGDDDESLIMSNTVFSVIPAPN